MYLFVHSVVLFYSYENKDRETMNYKLIEGKKGGGFGFGFVLCWIEVVQFDLSIQLKWISKDEFISYLKRIYL